MPETPRSAKADQLLATMREAVQAYMDGDDGAATKVVEAADRLDTHLSMGGTPPEAWTDGPDEPLVDAMPVRGCSCGEADWGAPGHDGDPVQEDF